MLSPPLPASKNLRPTEGMASKTWTACPAACKTSAAIRPAGPPPITATEISKVRISRTGMASAGVGKGFNACALWGEKSRAQGGLRVGAGHRIAVAAQLGYQFAVLLGRGG